MLYVQSVHLPSDDQLRPRPRPRPRPRAPPPSRPRPRALALAPLVGGSGTAPFQIPNQAVLVGLRLTVQSVLLDTTTFHAEFSSALEFAVRP